MFKILFALMLVHCNASSVYYFGSQSLMCLHGPLFSSTSSAPSRFSYSPWHRLIKYKNYIIEWGTGEYSINYQHPHSRRCRVTWESRPAGRSSKSINEVDNFGRMYEFYNGEYSMIFNNCHMFANGLSRFLTYNTRPNSCAVYIYTTSTCPTEKINAFTSTYSHFKGRPNCNNYRRKQIIFQNNYCENMDAQIFPTAPATTPVATAPTPSTRRVTLSVMDLARRMAREREEMMRRGQ